MTSRIFFAITTCFLLTLPLMGCPSCPYESRCEGDVLVTCSLGVDQIVGSEAYYRQSCSDPNPVCVSLDARTAQCAMDESSECAADFIPRCEDGLVLSCLNSYLVAQDCIVDGNSCLELSKGPRCVLEPLTRCDAQQFESYCEQDVLISCKDAYVQAKDCSAAYSGGRCKEYENEYGRSAVCDNR